jgi:hypothetical protein
MFSFFRVFEINFEWISDISHTSDMPRPSNHGNKNLVKSANYEAFRYAIFLAPVNIPSLGQEFYIYIYI